MTRMASLTLGPIPFRRPVNRAFLDGTGIYQWGPWGNLRVLAFGAKNLYKTSTCCIAGVPNPDVAADLMRIMINGESRELAPGLTVAALLTELGIDTRKVAVERNLEIVPKSTFATTEIGDGDRLEIVHFIGGG